MDLKAIKNLATFPSYRRSRYSSSVKTFARLHSLAKKKVVSIPEINKLHHCQLLEIPCFLIISVTYKGVSAANVVATIESPAMYHGKFLPPKKKSAREEEALSFNLNPIKMNRRSKPMIILQSKKANSIIDNQLLISTKVNHNVYPFFIPTFVYA